MTIGLQREIPASLAQVNRRLPPSVPINYLLSPNQHQDLMSLILTSKALSRLQPSLLRRLENREVSRAAHHGLGHEEQDFNVGAALAGLASIFPVFEIGLS
jgi:hypothetical protein